MLQTIICAINYSRMRASLCRHVTYSCHVSTNKSYSTRTNRMPTQSTSTACRHDYFNLYYMLTCFFYIKKILQYYKKTKSVYKWQRGLCKPNRIGTYLPQTWTTYNHIRLLYKFVFILLQHSHLRGYNSSIWRAEWILENR